MHSQLFAKQSKNVAFCNSTTMAELELSNPISSRIMREKIWSSAHIGFAVTLNLMVLLIGGVSTVSMKSPQSQFLTNIFLALGEVIKKHPTRSIIQLFANSDPRKSLSPAYFQQPLKHSPRRLQILLIIFHNLVHHFLALNKILHLCCLNIFGD